MTGDVLFYGDPHGEWRPLLRACQADPPAGVVILGDCDLGVPLRVQIKPVFDAGIIVHWIPGNHDKDTVERHDNLWGDYPQGNLHGRFASIGGLRVAGLGGVFKEKVWYPRYGEAEPLFATRQDYHRGSPRALRWRAGLPLHLRDAVFPEDVQALRSSRADVLVTHEAPSCHRHGFIGIDRAAAACRARLIVHGHQHESYSSLVSGSVQVRGLAIAEVFRLRREDLP